MGPHPVDGSRDAKEWHRWMVPNDGPWMAPVIQMYRRRPLVQTVEIVKSFSDCSGGLVFLDSHWTDAGQAWTGLARSGQIREIYHIRTFLLILHFLGLHGPTIRLCAER